MGLVGGVPDSVWREERRGRAAVTPIDSIEEARQGVAR